MEHCIVVKANVSIRKKGEGLMFKDQLFGPFTGRASAEQCVLALAGRPNVVSALVVPRRIRKTDQDNE